MIGRLPDLVFPRRCLACRNLVEEAGKSGELCFVCAERGLPLGDRRLEPHAVPGGDLQIWSLRRFEGILVDLIHRMKFQRDERVGERLGEWLAAGLPADGVLNPDLVLPVPLHPKRLRSRGFNQALLVARAVAARLGVPLDPFLLRRVRATPPQTDLSRPARLKNIRGAFACSGPERVEGRRVLIVDDVTTTGATLAECARVVRAAGAAAVEGMVLARV